MAILNGLASPQHCLVRQSDSVGREGGREGGGECRHRSFNNNWTPKEEEEVHTQDVTPIAAHSSWYSVSYKRSATFPNNLQIFRGFP